jgi:molybdopterin synthase catalytic subunit
MDSAEVRLTGEVLDPAALGRAVALRGDPGADGAIVSFLGVVRASNLGRRIVRLDYEAYEPLAVKALAQIVAEAAEYWPLVHLGIHHRVGSLHVGEASVAIAAASAHRADAFAACRYAIERVKQIVPIWKREVFDGGEVWVEGAAADPDNEAAREAALERACMSR